MARPLRAALVLATVIPIAIASGCGSNSSSSAGSTTTSAAATTAPATTAPATTAPATTAPATTAPATTAPATTAPSARAASKIAVAADPSGALAYVQKTLTAPAGSITFEFTNNSPVQHNLTFEDAGTEHELGATKTITSGTASLTLTLPKGTYNYYCSVPGHEAAGMKGTLTVK